MPAPLEKKYTLNELRSARATGERVAVLTCYDFTTAKLMHAAGVPALLVGDSAANVILGHSSTLPVSLAFMIELTAAVRRGAPDAFLIADMPFGSYQASDAQGVRNVSRMLKLTGCDCIKLEVAPSHASLVSRLADAGVAVMAHLGLKPQSVQVLGGYAPQGKTAGQANAIVQTAVVMQKAGAAALLLETVPPAVSEAVVAATEVPVIGCGAGPACHGSVIVTHDGLGLTGRRAKFVPALEELSPRMVDAFARYVESVQSRSYPAAEHQYTMPPEAASEFKQIQRQHTSIS